MQSLYMVTNKWLLQKKKLESYLWILTLQSQKSSYTFVYIDFCESSENCFLRKFIFANQTKIFISRTLTVTKRACTSTYLHIMSWKIISEICDDFCLREISEFKVLHNIIFALLVSDIRQKSTGFHQKVLQSYPNNFLLINKTLPIP